MENKKLVVITGASAGIGEATAKLFASKGYPLLLLARRVDKMKEMKLQNCLCLECDVTDEKQISDCIQQGEKLYGPVDCLVNNAGVYYPHPDISEQKLEDWFKMIDVNCKGILTGIKVLLPGMKERKTGTIINVSSLAGKKVYPGAALYTGTKFFVHSVTESMRAEMVKFNIRFSVVAPGPTFSEMLAEEYKKFSPLQPEKLAESILFVYSQPQDCCIREIVVSPTAFGE